MKIKFVFTTIILGLIATSSFSQKIVWKPKAELPLNLYSGSAVTCQDKIYFIGGQKDLGSSNYIASNRLFEYNLDMDEWIEKPNMPTARYNFAAATVEGKIYAIGGDLFLDENEMYDPATETWQTLTSMPTARQHIKAAVVNGKIYIIGGLLIGWTDVSTKNEVYDPLTDTWEELAPIPIPKHNYATVVYNDKIYIFGGDTKEGNNAWVQTSTVEVYDPATNTWDTSISLPAVRFNPGIGLIDSIVIITGGNSGSQATTSVDFFNLETGLWSQGNSLPNRNVAMGSTVLNDKIYIIGGATGPGAWIGYNTVYEGIMNYADNWIPELYYPISDDTCVVNELFNWTLPDFTFVDDDTLAFSATLVNDVLPAWLSFNPESRTLTGTPIESDTLAIVITAIDNYEATVTDTFNLVIQSPQIGIDQLMNKNELFVFPNPARYDIQVYVNYSKAILKSFQICTIEGKIIKEGRLESDRINISDLRKGMFLLKIETDKGIITKRIIVE